VNAKSDVRWGRTVTKIEIIKKHAFSIQSVQNGYHIKKAIHQASYVEAK
jgi:hypothetical protein